jgi:hypothetical protein
MNTTKNYQIVSQYILDKYIEKISCGGANDLYLNQVPKEVSLIGMLSGENQEEFLSKSDEEKLKFKALPSIGLNFRIQENAQGTIYLNLVGNLFYREKPTFEEQINYLHNKYKINYPELTDRIDFIKASKGEHPVSQIREQFVDKYRKINLKSVLSDIAIFENGEFKNEDKINQIINTRLSELMNSLQDKSYLITKAQFPIKDYIEEDLYNLNLQSHSQSSFLNWSIEIKINVHNEENLKLCRIQFINRTPRLNKKIADLSHDTTLYNAGISVSSDNIQFENIKLNMIKHDYIDPVSVKGLAENCSVDYNYMTNTLSTSNVPVFIQKRLKTNDTLDSTITFESLINRPIDSLIIILDVMKSTLAGYQKDYEDDVRLQKSRIYLHKEESEIESFRQEIKKFENGIELMKRKHDVLKAFLYMNKTFSHKMYQNQQTYKGWKLFQIVFIVSQLNEIVYSEYKNSPDYNSNDIDVVDLLYFPTGGGKTEAFIGCVVFTLFFDRLRGKKQGISALIKYPLRLLSVQQLDRVLTIIVKANELIKSLGDYDLFSLGYYVGSQNTENTINTEMAKKIESFTKDDFNNKFKVIDVCPYCGEMTVQTHFDKSNWKIIHECTTCSNQLPIYTIDDEIYRYLPSVIIGTVDKLAMLGTSPKYKLLYGVHQGFCTKHGFTTKNKCERCSTEVSPINLKDPIYTLSIQDELHLVRESLGTFASHYESFLNYYSKHLILKAHQKKIKYIAATATISNYEEHVLNLYSKYARSFPVSVKGKNVYSFIDEKDISRYIIGFAPYGGSMIDGIQKSVTYFRELISTFFNNPQVYKEVSSQGFEGDNQQLNDIFMKYYIEIVYHNSKSDTRELASALQNQGNNYLHSKGLNEYNISEISGDSDFKDIKGVIYKIQKEADKKLTPNLIMATSSISHGVDESSFNQIYFYGMPNNTAEYIQAYSRVGRTYPGFVMDIIRLVRDRDKSYLKNFVLFHEYKDKLVEPVPINKWAKKAIYSTLPGLFAGLLIQGFGSEFYHSKNVKDAFLDGRISKDDLKKQLIQIYGCNDISTGKEYAEIIDTEVDKIYQGIINLADGKLSISEILKLTTTIQHGPMSSLRDIDVMLEMGLS